MHSLKNKPIKVIFGIDKKSYSAYNKICDQNGIIICGCSLVAKPQPSKLMSRVRLPSPAPFVPVAQLDRATAF